MYPARRGAAALLTAPGAYAAAVAPDDAYTGGTLGAPLAPIPTIAWNIPGARRTAGVEGTYRWNPER